MEQEIIALNSDTLNRYGYYFALSGLEKSIKDNFDKGMPMCIGHDLHRAYGWTIPFALYFEPKITRLLGKKLLATTDDEYRQTRKAHENFMQRRFYEAWQPHQEKFLNLIGECLSSEHMRVDIGCVAAHEKGLALGLFPDLFSQKDDDGLLLLSVILKYFTYLGQGVFKHKNSEITLFAHTYFRRSQSIYNNFHFYFLDELIALRDNPDITIKLCISEDLVGYAPSHHETMELEYHWGPKFSDDISSIKYGIARHECNDFQRAYYGISRTEFYWKKNSNEMTFEMEELRDQPCLFEKEETYHCRYVHSIYDAAKNEFIHFDGAIRSYDLETMSERLEKNFVEYGRKAIYKKLFRIDGRLPLHLWKLLSVHYLQGNPLIYEYFGLGEERELQQLQPRELPKEKELLPFSIEKEDGIRLLVSYHIPDNIKIGRYIDRFDIMGSEVETIECLENLVHEVKKSLLRLGHDLEIPKHVRIVKIADRYWNIPSIMHAGENACELLATTIKALTIVFEAMLKRGMDMDISFTVGFLINNRLIRVSSYGNIRNQLNWINENMPFPADEEGFSNWIVKQRKYIEQFQEKSDDPLITSLVQTDGVLFIKRKHIRLKYDLFEDDGGLKFKIEMPPKDDELYDLIKQQKVEPKLLSIINEGKWSDTNENYYTSIRSKFLDDHDEAGVLITNWEPLALYWSKS